jgi:ribosome-associated toxin RatA of RatAB toxin-antitoxin module
MALTFTRRYGGNLSGEPELVYDILTEYDTYSEWMPLLSTSRLLAREGNLAIAEFELRNPTQETVQVECIHSKNRAVIVRLLGGRVPLNKVEWTIAPAGAGCHVRVAEEFRLGWKWILPRYYRALRVPRLFRALQDRLSAFAPGLAVGEGEKVLDLIETAEGMVLWLRGKKYIVKPSEDGA